MRRIDNLIDKYTKGDISSLEMAELSELVERADEVSLEAKFAEDWKDYSGDSHLDKGRRERLFPLKKNDREQKPGKFFHFPRLAVAAASLLLFISAGLIWSLLNVKSDMAELASMEVFISAGEEGMSTVTLPDGSVVKLNARSVLKYASDFGTANREVSISGEGYFDVAKNKENKFVVKADGMSVTVYGTAFNIYAYPESDYMEMSLVEGSVALEYRESFFNVRPDQKVCIQKSTGNCRLEATDNRLETVWMQKALVFKHEPLCRVLDVLQRRFGVQIDIPEGLSLKDKYTGTFNDKRITDILDVLKIHYGFSYHISDSHITLTLK